MITLDVRDALVHIHFVLSFHLEDLYCSSSSLCPYSLKLLCALCSNIGKRLNRTSGILSHMHNPASVLKQFFSSNIF